MNITELSIKRPSAIIMFVVLILGLGLFGYSQMGADLLPAINVPVITVSTTYPGAGADEVKKDIVKPIEDAIAGISGIDTISSSAREGYGLTVLRFTMETDMNTAFIDVQKALDATTSTLPKDASKPVLYKVDLNQFAVLTVALSGDVPYDELYNQANIIKTMAEKIPDVGNVSIVGGDDKQLMVYVDKTALEYYKIDINTVMNNIRGQNVNMPAGEIQQKNGRQTLKIIGEFKDINDVKNMLVPIAGGGSIRLGEIAEVKLEYPEAKQILKLNGEHTIGINFQKKSNANVVKAVEAVKKQLAELEKTLPKGTTITIANDSSKYIRSSLNETQRSLVEGILTTTVVLFFFLRKWRSSLIVLFSIPTSMIATFFAMYLMGFTLNTMSLMGLALCVGILVDDSIVILENIQKHLAMGKTPIKAAIDGRREIGMAAIAITACDIVVYMPVAFVSGMSGQFLRQFGLTVAAAAFFSLIISFTLTPMLASRWLKQENEEEQKEKSKFQKMSDRVNDSYKKFLVWSLSHRWRVIGTVGLGIALSIALIPLGFIQFEFMQQSDQSTYTINMQLISGSTLAQTNDKAKQVEDYLKTIPEVKDFYTYIGNNNDEANASISVMLKSKAQRKKSQSKLATEMRDWGKASTSGTQFMVSEAASMGGGGSSKPIAVNVKGNDMKMLKEIGTKVEEVTKTVAGLVDIENSARAGQSEYRVNVDRLASSVYGVSPQMVASAVRTGVQGTNAGVFRQNGEQYDITVKFEKGQINNSLDIASIKVMNTAGQLMSLDQIATIIKADSPNTISRQDRQDMITISANIQGKTTGEVSAELQKKVKQIELPNGYTIDYGANQKAMADSLGAMGLALLASLAFVYMILVVLYNSYLTPLIRMLALPCAIIGALGLTAILGKPIDIMAMIGLIMLDGLASKNGTLLIDYTNTLTSRGVPLKEALIEAGTTRLRPIIMTSMTMIVGMLPAALAIGDGSETKSGMALIVIGGMISSTILTPILLPVVYTLIDDYKHIFKRKNKSNVNALEAINNEI